MNDIAVEILLFFGVTVCALSSLGIVVMKGGYDKLHYLSPMSTVGAAAIAAAVVLHLGVSWSSLKVVVLLLLLCISSAVLTKATARAMKSKAQRAETAARRRES